MKKKIELFLKKNGFLTLLFLCVVLVASATFYLATRDLGTGSEDFPVSDERDFENLNMDDLTDVELEEEIFNPSEVTTLDDELEEEEEQEPEEDVEEIEEPQEPEEEAEEVEAPQVIQSEPIANSNMIYPVEGDIITDFVNDSLIYSVTLDEWRAHLGIDIKAEINTVVRAPLGGVIKSLYEDELWGKVIVIDHGNGLESKLANLGTTKMVREGLEVSKGDHIATVGKSAKIEMLMEDHLHFEVIKDGKNIDPRSIIN